MDYDMLYNKLPPSELYHHGIKGQKHGVRNAEWYPIAAFKKSKARLDDFRKKQKVKQEQRDADKLKKANRKKQLAELKYETEKLKSATKAVRKGQHVSLENGKIGNVKVKKQKDIANLSDEELTKGIARLNQEKQYRNLMQELYGGQGKQYLKDQMAKVPGDVAKKSLTAIGTKYLTKGLDSAIGKALDSGKDKKSEEPKDDNGILNIFGKADTPDWGFTKASKGKEVVEHVSGEVVDSVSSHRSSGKKFTDGVIYQKGPTQPMLPDKSKK